MTATPDRPGIDQLTSDQLDQLYAERDALRAQLASRTVLLEGNLTWQTQRAERAEAAIARVRALHSRWEYDANDCSVCVDSYGTPRPYPCPTVAALDG